MEADPQNYSWAFTSPRHSVGCFAVHNGGPFEPDTCMHSLLCLALSLPPLCSSLCLCLCVSFKVFFSCCGYPTGWGVWSWSVGP